jgi:hypothetical protein
MQDKNKDSQANKSQVGTFEANSIVEYRVDINGQLDIVLTINLIILLVKVECSRKRYSKQ